MHNTLGSPLLPLHFVCCCCPRQQTPPSHILLCRSAPEAPVRLDLHQYPADGDITVSKCALGARHCLLGISAPGGTSSCTLKPANKSNIYGFYGSRQSATLHIRMSHKLLRSVPVVCSLCRKRILLKHASRCNQQAVGCTHLVDRCGSLSTLVKEVLQGRKGLPACLRGCVRPQTHELRAFHHRAPVRTSS